MSLVITQRPETTISGETSRWNAVGNPIVYKMQRRDYDFDQVNNNGGLLQLQFNSVDLSLDFTISDVVYMKSDNGVYSAAGTVTAVSFSTNTLVTVDITYVSPAPGGLVNNHTTRPGYNVSVLAYEFDGTPLHESPFVYSPDSTGLVTAIVSAILRPPLSPDNNFNPAGINMQEDAGVYRSFYIDYLEDWTGNTGSDVYESDVANIFHVILGARQIPAPYGGNMAEYVTWEDRSPLGNWLTRFSKPVMWKDYPLYIGFIAGELSAVTAYRLLLANELPISGSSHFGTGNTATDHNTVKIIDFNNVYEVGTFDDNDKNLLAVLLYNSPPFTDADYITEVIEIEVRDVCRNPIMLLGRNSLGGPMQWVFEWTQEYTFDYGNDRKAKRLVLHTDGLTLNQWEVLQDFITLGQVYRNNLLELTSTTIKTSTRIGQQVYVVEPDGSKIGVIVIPTKNQTKTRQYNHEFEIEIEFPEVFAV